MIRKTTVFLSWVTMILWLLVIFSLSSQPGTKSNDLSKSVTKQIVKVTQKVIVLNSYINSRKNVIIKLNNLIRKYAHVILYLVLGILVINAFILSGIRGYKAFIFSLIFCFFYATSDEIYQLFVPGRGAKATDVLIDALGAVIGMLVYNIICRLFYQKYSKKTPTSLRWEMNC
ncbi:VanZ family protein [Caldicellulosiruptor owensensis OL]|uniref:VanZ family protein n=1 Tax=Caldicellulosiruptor owensensis (strain ATCC 700167 / DSM 13100 / OL) TaxID=632518 RepID=E4Q5S1_CALOW|nr:VanZ family protein [Caldicellulosiruptor owensensis]ADQ05480.1 VanZ family protein [Caldicellulosiruptor owensensis OL]